MSNIIPVTFQNKDYLNLFGILHLPDKSIRKKSAIILLSPGIKMRVAPHRMYNKMAEKYAELGFPVLRFDFYGLGDAEGHIEINQLSNIYNSIQLGRYTNDTISSLDWFQKEYGINDFIVGGLCGGAITGLLTAENDSRITALLALGIPVSLDVGDNNWHKYLSRGQLDQLGGGYLKNLLKPKSWLRLLTFQSDYRVIFKSIKQKIVSKSDKNKSRNKSNINDDQNINDNTNPMFSNAFFSMLETSRPMLHIFSGNDRLAWEFEEKFVEPNEKRLANYKSLYEIHTIENANHILSHPDWFNQMLDISSAWLRRFK